MIRNLLLITTVAVIAACTSPSTTSQPQIPVFADSAMVVTAHPLATEIGLQVLKDGGNAFDAAVAVQYALAVAYPEAGNIGGGGFMVGRRADGTVVTLDFREKAPMLANRDMYLDSLGEVIPDLSWFGHLAAGVPGAVAGMQFLHDSLGSIPMARLIQPAIDLAKSGYDLTPYATGVLHEKLEYIQQYNTQPNTFTAKTDWREGDHMQFPNLAKTLERIRDQGMKGFYEGETAELILAEMERGGGIITKKDLISYRPKWRPAVTGTYHDLEIISMGPPSSGGIALIQLLNSIEPFPVHEYAPNSTEAVHLFTEAERRVFADRAEHLGDPDFHRVPIQGLTEKSYQQARMQSFDLEKATPSDSVAAGIPQVFESEQTTHFSIVDADGNAVSITTTLNGNFGSCVLVGGAGFFLNNEMDDFSSKPGVANYFGLVGAEANAIAPGKRMLSSMTPTIVLKNGNLWMVVGTPGGSKIITSVFQTIVDVHDFGLNIQEAVTLPRVHAQWLPDEIWQEPGALSPSVMEDLSAKGHQIKEINPYGHVDAILVLEDGKLAGGADPRGDSHSSGF
ncbi:gamma-glutamyltransferase [Pontibacter sp. G13]|uniref:gamma-glutamyltransferase n=1 Tax=Pontibacter sp. G13 TaxID=3074898 RepID=UPI00288BCB1B|nr:gamma-glutamyltransferase [Pontibacter sp. G13]WNJ16883.1 gamma-glutamyltransferase [Pontibacter sp. G13]